MVDSKRLTIKSGFYEAYLLERMGFKEDNILATRRYLLERESERRCHKEEAQTFEGRKRKYALKHKRYGNTKGEREKDSQRTPKQGNHRYTKYTMEKCIFQFESGYFKLARGGRIFLKMKPLNEKND